MVSSNDASSSMNRPYLGRTLHPPFPRKLGLKCIFVNKNKPIKINNLGKYSKNTSLKPKISPKNRLIVSEL